MGCDLGLVCSTSQVFIPFLHSDFISEILHESHSVYFLRTSLEWVRDKDFCLFHPPLYSHHLDQHLAHSRSPIKPECRRSPINNYRMNE